VIDMAYEIRSKQTGILLKRVKKKPSKKKLKRLFPRTYVRTKKV